MRRSKHNRWRAGFACVLAGLAMDGTGSPPHRARAQESATVGDARAALPAALEWPELRRGRELLATGQFLAARQIFGDFLKAHPGVVQAELGLGDAQLGLHRYEAAEASYRAAVAQQPELWQAHKNLVVVEAALGRWDEFDRERAVLRLARERGAPGISARESDVIDSFTADGRHWVVRAYFDPLGRSEALYNFERFSAEGRVATYISLENAKAAQAALAPADVRIGGSGSASPPHAASAPEPLALNWYTGAAHGTVKTYADAPPSYERLRADVLHWLNSQPAALRDASR